MASGKDNTLSLTSSSVVAKAAIYKLQIIKTSFVERY